MIRAFSDASPVVVQRSGVRRVPIRPCIATTGRDCAQETRTKSAPHSRSRQQLISGNRVGKDNAALTGEVDCNC